MSNSVLTNKPDYSIFDEPDLLYQKGEQSSEETSYQLDMFNRIYSNKLINPEVTTTKIFILKAVQTLNNTKIEDLLKRSPLLKNNTLKGKNPPPG